MGDAVVGHHAAQQQFVHTQWLENIGQRRVEKAVGVGFDDDGRGRGGGEDAWVDGGALGVGIEEGRRAGGDVLDEDHWHVLAIGLEDQLLDPRQRCVGFPEWEIAAGEVVVLDVDDDQGRAMLIHDVLLVGVG